MFVPFVVGNTTRVQVIRRAASPPVRHGARYRRILSAPCAAWVRIPSKRRELSAKGVKTMSYENWKDKIGTFEVMDMRGKSWISSPR